MKWERISILRWTIAALCVLLIGLSWWQVSTANSGLIVEKMEVDGVPLRVMMPTSAETVPGVLIAHGFAGSQQIMLGYGYVLAHAGYGVVLWDFSGHGANPAPLDRAGDTLQSDLATAYAVLASRPEIDPARISLLGHSMGSGAVMVAGIDHAEQYRATVAVSPTDADVSPTQPRNLLLMAGALEPAFVANASGLLAAAGGPNEALAEGLARKMVTVPAVEHITILFNGLAHGSAVDWIGQSVGAARVSPYRDVRMGWYGLHLLAWLGLVLAIAPAIKATSDAAPRRSPWHWAGMLIGVLLASAVLFLLNLVVNVAELGGLMVGMALAIWFGVFGLVWLLLGFRPRPPHGRDLLWGLFVFGILWLAFGALAQVVWLPWLLNTPRLLLWLPISLLLLPSQLAWGLLLQTTRFWQKLGWWAAHSLILIAGLLLALAIVPGLFFLALVLPLIPIVYGVMGLVDGAVARPWAIGLGNALFFAWLLAAVFPLA